MINVNKYGNIIDPLQTEIYQEVDRMFKNLVKHFADVDLQELRIIENKIVSCVACQLSEYILIQQINRKRKDK